MSPKGRSWEARTRSVLEAVLEVQTESAWMLWVSRWHMLPLERAQRRGLIHEGCVVLQLPVDQTLETSIWPRELIGCGRGTHSTNKAQTADMIAHPILPSTCRACNVSYFKTLGLSTLPSFLCLSYRPGTVLLSVEVLLPFQFPRRHLPVASHERLAQKQGLCKYTQPSRLQSNIDK